MRRGPAAALTALKTREQILRFRSEETRRRALRDAPVRIRRELLEEEGV